MNNGRNGTKELMDVIPTMGHFISNGITPLNKQYCNVPLNDHPICYVPLQTSKNCNVKSYSTNPFQFPPTVKKNSLTWMANASHIT